MVSMRFVDKPIYPTSRRQFEDLGHFAMGEQTCSHLWDDEEIISCCHTRYSLCSHFSLP